jgi:hypothetical protein
MNALGKYDANIQRLYSIALDRAQGQISNQVFHFLPEAVRRALVAEQILILVNSQDEDTADSRIRNLVHALHQVNQEVFA